MEEDTLENQLYEVEALLKSQAQELKALRKQYHNAYSRYLFLATYQKRLLDQKHVTIE